MKFGGGCEDPKVFAFDCSVGSNNDEYSTSMKEVAEYIGRKFGYVSDIQMSLENKMKTIFPSPTRPTGTGDDVELSRYQKFM